MRPRKARSRKFARARRLSTPETHHISLLAACSCPGRSRSQIRGLCAGHRLADPRSRSRSESGTRPVLAIRLGSHDQIRATSRFPAPPRTPILTIPTHRTRKHSPALIHSAHPRPSPRPRARATTARSLTLQESGRRRAPRQREVGQSKASGHEKHMHGTLKCAPFSTRVKSPTHKT